MWVDTLVSVPISRGAVSRRLRASGVPYTPARRSSLPSDRRAWALLTGEVFPTAVSPATRDEAETLPAFGRGVELICSTVAGIPFRAYKEARELGVWQRLADQPMILTDPDPMSTAWHWKFAAMKDLIEAGNHVSLLGDMDWRTGRPGWLVPLPAAQLGLVTDAQRPGWYGFTVGGVVLDPSEVLHLSAGNRSGEVLGQSILDQYQTRLGEHLTAEQWAGKYLAGGGLPPAIIQAPSVVSDDQLAEFRDRWRGMVETGEATIIPAGATVTPLVSDAQRQQLVEARQWNAAQAAMMLGVPPHKLGLSGPNMTYQNVIDADISWEKDTIDRWAQPIANTISKYLLPAGVEARPDYAARMRTDPKMQAEVVTTLVGGPILSRDEGRQMLQYAPESVALREGSTSEGVPDLTTGEVA